MTVVGHGGSCWRRDGHGGPVIGFVLRHMLGLVPLNPIV